MVQSLLKKDSKIYLTAPCMPYTAMGWHNHTLTNKLRFRAMLKVFWENVVQERKKRSVIIYTEVWVMSEIKIHPNSQTALGLQNNCAVPAVVNDIKAKCLVRNATGILLSWIYTSQYCWNYWRALSKDHKLCSVCLVKQQHCRCFFESFGAVKFKTSCKIQTKLYPLPVMDRTRKISHPAVT